MNVFKSKLSLSKDVILFLINN